MDADGEHDADDHEQHREPPGAEPGEGEAGEAESR